MMRSPKTCTNGSKMRKEDKAEKYWRNCELCINNLVIETKSEPHKTKYKESKLIHNTIIEKVTFNLII